jgi:hypothetical protein
MPEIGTGFHFIQLLKKRPQKVNSHPGAYNASSLGGRDQEDGGRSPDPSQ